MAIFSEKGPDYRPIGADGTVLKADSSQPEGVIWESGKEAQIIQDFEITSFTISSSGIVWTSGTVSAVDFVMAYNRAASGGYITDTIETENITGALFETHTFTPTSPYQEDTPGAMVQFAVHASGECGDSGNHQVNLYWMQKNGWGSPGEPTFPIPGYDSTFVGSVIAENSAFTTGYANHLMQFNVEAGDYAYFVTFNPSEPKFTDRDSGLVGGFQLISSGVSYTNPAGFVDTYNVWRSDNSGLGQIDIEVT